MRSRNFFIVLLALSLLTACGGRVSGQFDKFLADHPTELHQLDDAAGYTIHPDTIGYQYAFYSFLVGNGMVFPGRMLKDYLDTTAVKAFKELKEDPSETQPLHLDFEMTNYEFKNFRAYMDLRVKTYRNGSLLFEKDYHAEGRTQTNKMFWAGWLAQRHAVHSSTKDTLDTIIRELLTDLRNAQASAYTPEE